MNCPHCEFTRDSRWLLGHEGVRGEVPTTGVAVEGDESVGGNILWIHEDRRDQRREVRIGRASLPIHVISDVQVFLFEFPFTYQLSYPTPSSSPRTSVGSAALGGRALVGDPETASHWFSTPRLS